MSDRYILRKDHLLPLLRRFAKEYRVIAPTPTPHGDTLFTPLATVEEGSVDLAHQAQNSAKSFLFPQVEVLFSYTAADCRFTPRNTSRPTIFFGLRSCDLSAILYMDVIFHTAGDPFYRKKRQDAILISLGCNEPFPNCFCTASRTGPFLEFGYDLQFTDLGDRFLVEVGRVRGAELVARWGSFFAKASRDDVNAQYQCFLESRGRFRLNVPMEQTMRMLADGADVEDVYAELSGRCQDCGGCAYICPTCTCFSIVDQQLDAGGGERLRTWDACTFAGFTRMAGGHDPVDHQRHAIKKRFQHKLLHDVRKHKRPSCVGCGRCVGMCFGGVDIVRFITMVAAKEKK
ncbi:MAG: 4Fe-4S dicluster domain-containing protein [Thermodesulfobacteriota bacterium]